MNSVRLFRVRWLTIGRGDAWIRADSENQLTDSAHAFRCHENVSATQVQTQPGAVRAGAIVALAVVGQTRQTTG